MRVVIIGAGAIGNALHRALARNTAHDIDAWDVVDGLVENQKKLEDIVPLADIIMLCVASVHITSALEQIVPLLRDKAIIATVTKGIEKGSLRTVESVITAYAPHHCVALISGPMLSGELLQKHGGAATIACSEEVYALISSIFLQTGIITEHTTDQRGVALCGVLKNIYSLGLGVLAGLQCGQNIRGIYTKLVLNEMRQIVQQFGGSTATVDLFCGVGDLIATGFSMESRNVRAGITLVNDPQATPEKSEGYVSAPLMGSIVQDTIHQG